jgi:small neutral amino acid transporter SnatA (MarC family)
VIPFFQPSPSDPLSPGKVFTFLFVMIWPPEVIGPFAKMTAGWDCGLKRRLAFQVITVAAIGAFAVAAHPALDVPGSVLYVLQVALGVLAIIAALRLVGVPALTSG